MARAEWDTVTDNSVKETRDIKNSGGKTVRFLASSSDNAQCDNRVKNREAGSPALGMVQGLVPHLPGLEKDKVYVISGPFPNFDPVSGPSQMLMATPVTAGATIIAVPTGPPPPAQHHQVPVSCVPGGGRGVVPPGEAGQAPVFHPPHPHMLHWDSHHPGGQIIPLRQPCAPVYYNLPPGSGPASGSSSGLQSPASEGGSCMSESSSTSGDQDMSEHSTGHTQMQAGPGGFTGKQVFFQPGPGYHHMPPMMPFPAHHVRSFQPGPPQYCHIPAPGPGVAPPCHLGHVMVPPHQAQHHHFNQVYISQ